MTKERPILMSAPMVRGILLPPGAPGAKSVTRRGLDARGFHPYEGDVADDGWPMAAFIKTGCLARLPAKYGAVGDTLWVREAWRAGHHWDERKGAPPVPESFNGRPAPHTMLHYEADGHAPDEFGRYRHARFMPRRASRLSLRVTGVKVERVQDISEADVAAEGVTPQSVLALWNSATRARQNEAGPPTMSLPIDLWQCAWTLINGRESWKANGFVWCVSFERVEAQTERPFSLSEAMR